MAPGGATSFLSVHFRIFTGSFLLLPNWDCRHWLCSPPAAKILLSALPIDYTNRMTKDPTSEFASPSATAAAGGTIGAGPLKDDQAFFGHPRGLSTLFFTEMWERFSYYGMRAILILFMTAAAAEGGLGMDTQQAGAIYGLYTAFVYLLALPGGWIADRLIGQRTAVLYGGIIIAAGHFSMAIPAITGALGVLPPFFAGLALIVVGTGLLKPNVSTMVGELYSRDDSRRDAGFSIFYMGINLGAFIAPIVTGYLGESINWHLGFAAAGLGMVLGVIQYLAGAGNLGTAGLRPNMEMEPRLTGSGSSILALAVVAILVLFIAMLQLFGVVDLTTAVGIAGASGVIIVALSLTYFGYMFVAGGLNPVEKRRMSVIVVLFFFSAVFWSGFEQAGSSLNLFARDLTNRTIGGWEMPASWLQSVNSIFIILLAPVFAWFWVWSSRRRLEPSSPIKFAFGLVFLGLGFLVMVGASSRALSGEQVSPMWLVLTYLLHTMGELALSPVGLSTVTRLAPHRMVGQMMGVWFMSIALGNLIAGQVAGLFDTLPLMQLFGAVAATAIGAGLILGLLSRPVRVLMGGIH
ncbi:peptide MFS transporter [soil metagenome]